MQTITIDQLRDIYNTAIRGNKILAIKMLKEGTNHPTFGGAMGLGEAKRLVELISDVNGRDGTRPDFDTIVNLLQTVRPYHGSADVAPIPTVTACQPADREVAAIAAAIVALDNLREDECKRVCDYLSARYG